MLGLSDTNKRKAHSSHKIPFTCKDVGLCCKGIISEKKEVFLLVKLSLACL